MQIGNAKYGAEYAKKKYFKLKDGESIFRILPPLGELASKGQWSQYYSVHYGYKNSEGKMRTFLSPLVVNKANKMIEKPDAALALIEKIKGQIEVAKKAGDEATVKTLQEYAGGMKSRFNLDKNHYMNAMDLQGNIGVLQLRHKAKLALEATIAGLRAKGIDPLSPDNGRFFVFRRRGMGLETTFQVEVYAEAINVAGIGEVKKELVHVLDNSIIDRLSAEAVELNKIFKVLTSEQVQQIVSTVDIKTGISPAIDALFARNDATNDAPGADEDETSNPYAAPTAAPVNTATITQAAAPAIAAGVAAPNAQPFVGYSQPVQATPAAQAPAPAAQAPAAAYVQPSATTTAQAVASTSDLDFLKEIGVKIG